MSTYFKSVRPDGTDFHTGTVQWVPEGGIPDDGHVVVHPNDGHRLIPGWADTYLSVATVPTDCTAMKWPCRLLEVVPDGREVRKASGDLPHKRCSTRWRVIREVDAHLALGPQGAEVAAIIDRSGRLTESEVMIIEARVPARFSARTATWDAAWDAALAAARAAAGDAAWVAVWDAAGDAARAAARAAWAAWAAARAAALATLVRDLISTEHHDTLMSPWRSVIGGE